MAQPAVIWPTSQDLAPKPDYMQYDPNVYKKGYVNMATGKTGTIMTAVGAGLRGLGDVFTSIFGGGAVADGSQGAGSGYNVPVQVGVESSTKKWITYAGIAGGALLLVLVLILAFKKK